MMVRENIFKRKKKKRKKKEKKKKKKRKKKRITDEIFNKRPSF